MPEETLAEAPLVVAVTTRALCDLEEEHQVFLRGGEAGYMAMARSRQQDPVRWGLAFPLVRKLLSFNTPDEAPLVEVVVLSRNDPMTGLRIMGSIEREGLGIEKAIFTKGRSPFGYLKALGVALFLSAEPEDVRAAADAGCAAALIVPRACETAPTALIEDELRLALDGDAVLFDDSAERVFVEGGAEAFHAHERSRAGEPLPRGPLAPFLEAIVRLQRRGLRVRTALVTARAVAAHARALRTLDAWGLPTDEAFFLCGASKAAFLAEFMPDLFLDDSRAQVAMARDLVPTGLVPRAAS